MPRRLAVKWHTYITGCEAEGGNKEITLAGTVWPSPGCKFWAWEARATTIVAHRKDCGVEDSRSAAMAKCKNWLQIEAEIIPKGGNKRSPLEAELIP